MKILTISSLLIAAMALPTLAHADVPPEPPTAEVTAEAEASVEVEDDILMVIDLPIAALSARDAGLEEEEVAEAIEGAEDIGLSAADASIVLGTEAEEVETRGKKKGFGLYVRGLLLEGYRGEELAAKIRERKEELEEMSDEEKTALRAELKEKLNAKREEEKKRRLTLHAKIKAEKAAGKKIKHRHDKLHDKLDAKRKAKRKEHMATKGKLKAKIAKEKRSDDPDKEKIKELRGELREERAEAREDKAKLDKREDKLDKREQRLTDKHEKREDKLQDKKEKRKDKVEAKKERREDKKQKLKDKSAPQ